MFTPSIALLSIILAVAPASQAWPLGLQKESIKGRKKLGLHSSKLTWKWRGALNETTILYIGPFMSFQVKLGEGSLASAAEA